MDECRQRRVGVYLSSKFPPFAVPNLSASDCGWCQPQPTCTSHDPLKPLSILGSKVGRGC